VPELLFRFKNFFLDADRRELRRGSDLVSLEPQGFRSTGHLIRNRDRVISKDDMIAAVWGGRIVSESALIDRINAVRPAVGDSGGQQRLIKTLQCKGIRFVGAVREEREPSTTPVAAAPVAPEQTVPDCTVPDRPSIARSRAGVFSPAGWRKRSSARSRAAAGCS
jgi:DNA-binding winged helix-turn-helix (wHTH) protein